MDKIYIKKIIQDILNREFSGSSIKTHINEYEDRINFCCPICRESSIHEYKKRANLYYNKLLYICFRCGEKMSFDKLCNIYNIRIDPDKKLEMIEHISSNISYSDYEDDMLDNGLTGLLKLDDLSNYLNSNKSNITDFKPIEKNSIVYNYLIQRGIYEEHHTNIYQAKNWSNSERYENIICLLNRRGNSLLSMQIRNLKDGRNRSFKIFNYETIYKWINNVDEINDMELSKVTLYNKIGTFFNILNVDFYKKVTIFEGYLDSLFYSNSIGVVGVNSDMRFIESNNLDIQYMYDNDDAGFKKSDEKIKMGYPVFLWNKLFESIVENKRYTDPYKLMNRIKLVKDLNKLSTLSKDPENTLELNKYFSNDIYDIRYINKVTKRRYIKRC